MSRRSGKRKQSRSQRRKRTHAERARQGTITKPVSQAASHGDASTPFVERPARSTVVSLDPLAPIIVRSARPMEGRSDADPARFPPPSTTAGCLRTAWARTTGRPFGPALADLSVAGPLLFTRAAEVLAPKPADALYFGHSEEARCVRAEPRPFETGCGADLPDGLLPVQLTESATGKPGDGPTWWRWDDLLAFRRGESVPHRQLSSNGWSPPKGDRRTHVTIDPTTGAAAPRQLFQTEGLDLDTPDTADRSCAGGLRILMRCDEALDERLVHLGGKRRLAALQPEAEDTWPRPPKGWLEQIGEAGGLCLTLLTPGLFSAGYRPGWLDDDTLIGCPPTAPELRLRLCAAAVERWQPQSGWDLAKRQPRPTRKLATAGATYWLRVLGSADPDALAALWLASISDREQDRRDGFGLALPSAWTPPA